MPSHAWMRVLGASLVAACALSSCAHDAPFVWVQDLPPTPAPPSNAYVIAPGDLLNIRVWGQEGMSARARVRGDGKISLPFLNDVEAAGYRPDILAQQIQTRVKDFLTNPVVTVALEELRPVSVSLLGEVAKPGQYAVDPGAGVLHVLASGGGLTDFAHKDRIYVLRNIDKKPTRIRFDYTELVQASSRASEFRMQSGDVVVVE